MTEAPPLARYAVIGNPIAHSRSPQIHALFSRQTGKPLRYERLLAPVDGFAAAVAAFAAEGGLGLNVTVPFKQDAYALAAAHLSSRARLAGAVNTLSWRDGAWHGCNTDGIGLVSDLLRLGVRLNGAAVLLAGAGGAARGVLQPLAQAGCARIHIVNRTAARALELAEGWRESGAEPQTQVTAGGLADAVRSGGWDLVINATASGLQDAAPDLPAGLYAEGAAAYDMMYGAQPTAFMRQAQADGASLTADGLGMLVGQAAESFFIWHGVRPDPAPVLTALREALMAGN
ncbi:MAG: shikimate dehydrogenase [Achromobacter pulmonis]|uniref:Shikimate dehydrogenase (NADP(+)) n=1 Tax=Achromobacter pulmonis TaxID=1389932 RepID=A0A6S7D519_9BURK|nr:shikimate dehydrogenase [Achromobacter pulmonis]MCF7767067.1 shikimate dehydrogenase [Achromobacter pulmonis]MPT27914.1 shikimate dehydrogenase [Achromobacter sp.]CAB3693934.1 Shikimate dehydrogenase (NADP(+)) [Achromobacter pulmonis]CAB3832604.1 Shikimate dehydrogenase (NADP(+)) [Achromobacter pulmonis]